MGVSLSLVEVTEQTYRVRRAALVVVASKPLRREEVEAAVREETPHEGTGCGQGGRGRAIWRPSPSQRRREDGLVEGGRGGCSGSLQHRLQCRQELGVVVRLNP